MSIIGKGIIMPNNSGEHHGLRVIKEPVELIGTARVKKVRYIDSNSIRGWFSNGASYVESGISGVWRFDDALAGSEKIVFGTTKIPDDMDRSEVATLKIGWSANGVSPGNCEWQLEYLWLSPGDDTTGSAEETLTTTGTASATSDGLVITAFTGIDLPSSTNQALLWKITRLSASANDTISGNVDMRGAIIEYTANKWINKTF